jgi:hypothetical protein
MKMTPADQSEQQTLSVGCTWDDPAVECRLRHDYASPVDVVMRNPWVTIRLVRDMEEPCKKTD